MMELNFEKIFKIPLFFMRVNRSHPDIRRNMTWAVQFLIMHGIFTLVFLFMAYSTIYYDLRTGDMTKGCANGTIAVLYFVVSFKYFMMLWHQDLLRNIIQTMKRDYTKARQLSTGEQLLISTYAYRGKWIMRLWLAVAVLSAALFPFKAIVLMIYYKTFEEFKLVPLYELTFPSRLEAVKNDLGPFIITFLLMMFYALYAMSMYIGQAPIGPVFMLHACGQLEILKRRIQKLFPEGKTYNEREKNEELNQVARKLQEIYCFVHKIQTCFQLVYELSLKGSIITLPITLYQIIESSHKGQLSLEFVTIFFGCIVLASCPCYYSDLLIEKGKQVREALYASGWERQCARRTRSSVLIMLTRMTRPLALRSMFGMLCLQALTEVFNQAYAIFNVLSAAWKNPHN